MQHTGSPSADVFTYQQYDVAGNVVRKIDGNGKQTQIDYDSSSNSYAFPSRITNPLSQSTLMVWDIAAGKVTTITDPNQNATTYDYTDPLDRLKSVTRPDAGITGYTYLDSSNTVTTTSDLTKTVTSTGGSEPCATNVQVTGDIIYDGLGRKSRTHQNDPEGTITIDTLYDALGRVYQVSNPYRTGDPINYTSTLYDSLSRVKNVMTPDTAATKFDHSGNQVTVTDPLLHQRTQTLDALQRLIRITEPNNVLTCYAYDPAGNLLHVYQDSTLANGICSAWVQQRDFTYDTLQRLLTAYNPESGTTTYTYDANGNLLTKASGTGTSAVTTTYLPYDGLNRITGKRYSSNQAFNVDYIYDTAPNGVGRLASVTATDPAATSNTYSTSYDSYDKMGRVLHSTQSIAGVSATFPFSYMYNVGGQPEQLAYPSGRIVRTCYNSAGRTQTVGNLVNSAATPYGTVTHYAVHGAIGQITLGNGLIETTKFDYDPTPGQQRELNTRLQPTLITAGNLLTLQYTYCPPGSANLYSCSANNGNLQSQTINDGSTARAQSYTYDALDRLATATETNSWSQTYAYDHRGNQALVVPPSSDPSTGLANLLAVRVSDPGTLPFDANNHLNGVTYDSRGNLTDAQANPNSFHATYDGENRLTSVTSTIQNTTMTVSYVYDGDGRRVQKMVTGGPTTNYVYDAQGNLSAEYSTAPNSDVGTQYLTADHLESTRLVTTTVLVNSQPTPSVVSRSDYLPFGQEIPTTWGNRAGYQPDPSQTMKFTGKERDAESSLDYFGARYFSGSQGRFISPDVPLADQFAENPQSWNLYSYGRNNPLSGVDPNGRGFWENLGNWWKYGVWGDDAGVQAEEAKRRTALAQKQQQNISRGHPEVFYTGRTDANGNKIFTTEVSQLTRESVFNPIHFDAAVWTMMAVAGAGSFAVEANQTIATIRAKAATGGKEITVTVSSRQVAEEILRSEFIGGNPGYANTTGMDRSQRVFTVGQSRASTYHWDPAHGPENPHGEMPHLQIHTPEGGVIRIRYPEPTLPAGGAQRR